MLGIYVLYIEQNIYHDIFGPANRSCCDKKLHFLVFFFNQSFQRLIFHEMKSALYHTTVAIPAEMFLGHNK